MTTELKTVFEEFNDGRKYIPLLYINLRPLEKTYKNLKELQQAAGIEQDTVTAFEQFFHPKLRAVNQDQEVNFPETPLYELGNNIEDISDTIDLDVLSYKDPFPLAKISEFGIMSKPSHPYALAFHHKYLQTQFGESVLDKKDLQFLQAMHEEMYENDFLQFAFNILYPEKYKKTQTFSRYEYMKKVCPTLVKRMNEAVDYSNNTGKILKKIRVNGPKSFRDIAITYLNMNGMIPHDVEFLNGPINTLMVAVYNKLREFKRSFHADERQQIYPYYSGAQIYEAIDYLLPVLEEEQRDTYLYFKLFMIPSVIPCDLLTVIGDRLIAAYDVVEEDNRNRDDDDIPGENLYTIFDSLDVTETQPKFSDQDPLNIEFFRAYMFRCASPVFYYSILHKIMSLVFFNGDTHKKSDLYIDPLYKEFQKKISGYSQYPMSTMVKNRLLGGTFF